jgi:hypothetical protein
VLCRLLPSASVLFLLLFWELINDQFLLLDDAIHGRLVFFTLISKNESARNSITALYNSEWFEARRATANYFFNLALECAARRNTIKPGGR